MLAGVIAGMLVLAGLVQLTDRGDGSAASAPAATAAPGPSAVEPSTTDPSNAGGTSDPAGQVTDEVDGDAPPTPSTLPPITADCTITEPVQLGASGESVGCVEAQLVAAGLLTSADSTFDASTDQAVKAYQSAKALQVDGIVGRVTAQSLGIWAGPTGPQPATDADCPDTAHGAVVDRANQRGWLCRDGALTTQFPITSAWSQPDPGTYKVYARDLNASSNLTGKYSTMTHFVAFTKGKYKGARIAFHSIPKYADGSWVQPLDSVGDLERRGDSSGCIRVLPDDAVAIWDWLAIGDKVHVIS